MHRGNLGGMMKIHLQSSKKTLHLWIPTALLTGRMLAAIITGDKNDPKVRALFSRRNLRAIRASLKSYTKKYGHFTLFRCEAENATVEIVI